VHWTLQFHTPNLNKLFSHKFQILPWSIIDGKRTCTMLKTNVSMNLRFRFKVYSLGFNIPKSLLYILHFPTTLTFCLCPIHLMTNLGMFVFVNIGRRKMLIWETLVVFFITLKEGELHYYSHFDGHFLDLQWCVQKRPFYYDNWLHKSSKYFIPRNKLHPNNSSIIHPPFICHSI